MFRQTFQQRAATTPGSVQQQDTASVDANQVVEAQRLRIVLMLLQGETYGLPGSDGTKWANFREWAKNQHPVLSMFFAHELHPFSRNERFCVMLCYLCWAFFVTCLFEKVTPEDYQTACDDVMPWFVLSFIIAACTVPYSTILKVLATCGCVQALPESVKNCVEFLGTIMLTFFGVLSVAWLGIGIVVSLAFDGGMFILVYLAGVAKSWFYWPILAGAMFLWKFKRAKSRFEEKHPGQLALAWPIDSHDTDDVEIKMGADGKPIVYQSPTRSPRSQEGDGRDPRTVAAITSQPGSPQMTPEITPHYPQQYNSSGGYSLPPHKPQHQQQYNGPPSPAHRVPAAMETQPQSPRLPAENPYCLSHLNNGESAVKVGQMSRSPSNGGRIPTEMSPVNAGYAPVNSQGHGGQPGGNPPVAVHHGGVLSVPPGWEVKVLPEGRTMFVDHNTQTTHWEPPVMHAPPLPPPSLPPSYHQHQAAMQRSPPSSPPSYHVHHASHGH